MRERAGSKLAALTQLSAGPASDSRAGMRCDGDICRAVAVLAAPDETEGPPLAVVAGSAVNQDGRSSSLAAYIGALLGDTPASQRALPSSVPCSFTYQIT